MQNDLAKKLPHLPPNKVQRLERAVDLILKNQKVEMILLYGSYARGDYKKTRIEEVGGYKVRFRSDYDFLLVTGAESGDVEFVQNRECFPRRHILGPSHELRKLMMEYDDAIQMTMIDIETLNHHISEWHYFYADIYREGIVLYDSGNCELEPPPETLSPTLRRQFAEEDFTDWFEHSHNLIITAQFQISQKMYSLAAFNLEQAYEAFYRAVILVYTHYNPHEHNLYSLRHDAERHDSSLKDIFSLNTQDNQDSFKRLHLAYIEPRFFHGYKIGVDELNDWYTEVKKLRAVVEVVCQDKIEALRLLEL